MQKRKLGNTDSLVTELGYGAWELRSLDIKDAETILNYALDSGINYFDTSPDYGPSEEYIGRTVSHRRNEYYLATKCGCNIDQRGKRLKPGHIWSRERLLSNIENSLRVLKTDHIDVWQLHGAIPLDLKEGENGEVIKTMLKLKQQGKVLSIGISFKNGQPEDELYPAGYGFKYIHEFTKWEVFDVMQVVYGGLTRQNELVISQTSEKGIGIIIRGVLRKYHNNYDKLFETAMLEHLLEENESRNDFLIRFALKHMGISSMIIGTKNIDHLEANIKAVMKGSLPDKVYHEAKKRLDAICICPRK